VSYRSGIGPRSVCQSTNHFPHSLSLLPFARLLIGVLVPKTDRLKLLVHNLMHLGRAAATFAKIEEFHLLDIQILESFLPIARETILGQPDVDTISWPLCPCIVRHPVRNGSITRFLSHEGSLCLLSLAHLVGVARLRVDPGGSWGSRRYRVCGLMKRERRGCSAGGWRWRKPLLPRVRGRMGGCRSHLLRLIPVARIVGVFEGGDANPRSK
jgi:hypothetical protein